MVQSGYSLSFSAEKHVKKMMRIGNEVAVSDISRFRSTNSIEYDDKLYISLRQYLPISECFFVVPDKKSQLSVEKKNKNRNVQTGLQQFFVVALNFRFWLRSIALYFIPISLFSAT